MKNSGEITRKKKIRDFTIVDNEILERTDLSLEAKGLLMYILHLPLDWKLYKGMLHKTLNQAENKVDRCFKELQEVGYIRSQKIVNQNNQFVGWCHDVNEDPLADSQFSRSRSFPKSEFPEVGELNDILSTNNLLSTNKKQNTNNILSQPDFFENPKENQDEKKDNLNSKTKEEKSPDSDPRIKEIIDDYNKITGRSITGDKLAIRMIKARLKEGHTVQEFTNVHFVKWKEWKGTEYQKYVVPDTLYREGNFNKYVYAYECFIKNNPNIDMNGHPSVYEEKYDFNLFKPRI
jgi:uncharacterized phage protein (TIGR02220 family)